MNSSVDHGCCETSWVRLLESLVTETVRIQVDSSASTVVGLLVDVDPRFITVVSTRSGRGDCPEDAGHDRSRGRVRRVYIPNNKIVTITPR